MGLLRPIAPISEAPVRGRGGGGGGGRTLEVVLLRAIFQASRPTISRLRALASLSPRLEAGRRKPVLVAGPVAVMHPLGFARFAVVRHDRGGCVAHRTARDHPEALERIAVLAMAPTASLSVRSDSEPDGGAAVQGRCAPGAPTWEAAPRG
jgi:pimeloyl-ACP methyl ester carboxylesterase